ncbi:unnamed protein product, partial [Vitis vinifera]|uniref:Uncharacterized protein n=1 Tax=Vitis vinifera TaxID=29760 RepID=D7SSQ9_VITVI
MCRLLCYALFLETLFAIIFLYFRFLSKCIKLEGRRESGGLSRRPSRVKVIKYQCTQSKQCLCEWRFADFFATSKQWQWPGLALVSPLSPIFAQAPMEKGTKGFYD